MRAAPRRRRLIAGFALACAPLAGPAQALGASPAGGVAPVEIAAPPTAAPVAGAPPAEADAAPPPASPAARNGREIYQRFREGLADPECAAADTGPRWRRHFAQAPERLAARDDDVLPLFGYVVDALREAHLPTEFALIPFVESGYRPGARSASGPAGLWQMIAMTARDHGVPVRDGYDGRLSPVDSTEAAVRYLKTLYGMFAGDWRLAAMAYNAGEYRILAALQRGGQQARDAAPEKLPGLSPITQAYVRKLHALSCLMAQADDREEWMRALDRPVPRLQAVTVPADVERIEQWAERTGGDPAQLRRLNPAFAQGRLRRGDGRPARLLAVAPVADATRVAPAAGDAAQAAATLAANPTTSSPPSPTPRRHTVAHDDSAWSIARQYGIRLADLLERNGLRPNSVLRPGRVLDIDPVGAAVGGE